MRYVNGKIMFPRRYAFLSQELSPYLQGNRSILDVGSSNGRLIKQIAENLIDVEIAGVDIKAQPGSVIPIKEYDGTLLPYADDSFDCVVLIDVLHHAQDQAGLLLEAKRVTRKHILIKDHYWKSRLDWHILKWADYFGNDAFGITLPYNYLAVSAWNQTFRNAGLAVLAEKLFTKYSLDPCKHVIYHLSK